MSAEATRRFRLTAAGWVTAGTATLAAIVGRITGVEEFVGVAMAAASAVAAASLVAWFGGRTLSLSTSLSSTRIAVGDDVRIDVALDPTEIGASGVTRDSSVAPRPRPLRLPRRLVADLAERSGTRRVVVTTASQPNVSIVHRARHRGLMSVGPLRVSVTDPLGLVERSLAAEEPATVLVVPNVVDLGTAHHDSAAPGSTGAPRRSEQRSDEFDTLREYVPGDDIRMVHWSSTARLGTPVVRVMEPLAVRRSTVVLHRGGFDTDHDAFERSVVAAASALASCVASGEAVRFLIDGTTVDVPVTHRDDLEAVLDRLAIVGLVGGSAPDGEPSEGEPSEMPSPGSLRHVDSPRPGDRLVVCCVGLDEPLSEWCAIESATGGTAIVIATGGPGGAGPTSSRGGVDSPHGPTIVAFGPDDDLAVAWGDAVSGRRR